MRDSDPPAADSAESETGETVNSGEKAVRTDGGAEEGGRSEGDQPDRTQWDPKENEYDDGPDGYYYDEHPEASRDVTTTPAQRRGPGPQQVSAQRGTAQQGTPAETTEAPAATAETGGDSGRQITLGRREFVAGGVGLAGLVAGGWWLFRDQKSASEQLIEQYVAAVNDNDWETVIDVHHEEAPNGNIDEPADYPEASVNGGSLLRNAAFDLEDVYESYSVSEGDELQEQAPRLQNGEVTLYQELFAVIKVDPSDVSEGELSGLFVQNKEYKRPFLFTVIEDDSGSRGIWRGML